MKDLYTRFMDFMSVREEASVKPPSSAPAALGAPPSDASSFQTNPQDPSPIAHSSGSQLGRGSVGSAPIYDGSRRALSLTGGPPSYNPSARDVAARHRFAAFGSYPCDFRSGTAASIPVFNQSRAGRLPSPPPPLPSDFQNFQPPLSAFSGVLPPVGSVEAFPPSPFLPDTAEWEESDSLFPSEDLAYTSTSAAKLAYVAGEAESLLTRYMGDLYAPVSDITPPGESSSTQSSFFVEHNLPKSGIVLPPDVIHEYERVSKAPRKPVPAGAHHFRFAQPHSEKYFDTEGPSPELLALGASLSSPNALTTPSFRKEDKKWKFMSKATRFSARLAVFQAALIDLLSRADDLGVT